MATISHKICDCCKKDLEQQETHWSLRPGSVTLDFKDMAAIQRDVSIKDCCCWCAAHLYEVLKKEIQAIQDKKVIPSTKARML